MRNNYNKILTIFFIFIFLGCGFVLAQTPVYLDPAQPIDKRVDDLLGRMTIDEKIGQMMQVDNSAINGKTADLTNYFMGSVLSGGDSKTGDNTTIAWADQYDLFQSYALKTRLKIPIIYGIDAVHGNNDILGTTIFPHNIGLGCTRNPDLVQKAAQVTAAEVAATGVDWTFAPCIAVPQDERWGRTYEGFGETAELAQLMSVAAVKGFQGDTLAGQKSILACAKHFLADGGTTGGRDQGNSEITEATIRKIHLPGYIAAINAGAGSIMASYSSVNGQKMHGYKYWLTDVLKTELGFKGFIVSDYAAIDQLGSDYTVDVEKSINAGMDMAMIPTNYPAFYNAMKSNVTNSKIAVARIDDAVKRILTIKFKMGLFEKPYADRSLISKVGSAENRAVARQCVRESMVLLKKKDGILPLPKTKANMRVLVAGSTANDLGNQCGGWSVTWQGKSGNITTGTTILNGLKKAAPNVLFDYSLSGDYTNTKADYSIVVIGETPYAEGNGDRSDLGISKTDVALLQKVKGYGSPVIVILVSGRPMILEKILHYSDVLIAAWLPGTEGDGVADVLFGDFMPKGLLSHTWPKSMAQIPINIGDANYAPLYEYGYGLTSFDDSPKGSEPKLQSAIVTKTGNAIELTFNKQMSNPSASNAIFSITKNGAAFNTKITASLKNNDNTTILLTLDSFFTTSDAATVAFTSGNITAADGGVLKPFAQTGAYNWTTRPAVQLPANIQAANYSDMFGVQTETCIDEGGGTNLTSIDDGDWIEYFINVPETDTYMFSIRTSSLSSGGNISLTSGGRTLGARSLPVTGNWLTWSTSKQLWGLYAGEQTLRITATKGGFKLHWLSIDALTDVENESVKPIANSLAQNYPNPFNPSTEIKYTVKEPGLVSLKIFNILGQEVKSLFNEYKQAGSYTIRFSSSELTGGVYFYTLSGQNFSSTKKMVLLK